MNLPDTVAFRIWLWSGLAVFIAILVSVIAIGTHNQHITTVQHRADKQDHFWLVVSGRITPSTPSVDNKLGLDLRSLLGPVSPSAAQLPKPLQEFRGDSNSYGGITAEAGFNPFDGKALGCNECGPLTQYADTQLLEIKRGHADQVLSANDTHGTKQSFWLPLVLLLAWVLSLPAWLALSTTRRRRHLAQYPAEAHTLNTLERTIAALPAGHPKRAEFEQLRTNLQAEMNQRLVGVGNATDPESLARVERDAKATLAAWHEGNRALN